MHRFSAYRFSGQTVWLVALFFITTFTSCSKPAGTSELTDDDIKTPPPSVPMRTVLFDYGFQLKNLPPNAKIRVWIPQPANNSQQSVTVLPHKLPAKATLHTEKKYGNQVLYLEPKSPEAGTLDFQLSYRVQRNEWNSLQKQEQTVKLSDQERHQFLAANRFVPLDGKPLQFVTGKELPEPGVDLGKQLYTIVYDQLSYDKTNIGYGKGDVNWVCDSRTGNCTDFHSLFISLCRSQQMPAKFTIGFPLPNKTASNKTVSNKKGKAKGTVSGYHCWASFFADGYGWVPVDISEADKHPEHKEYFFGNLTANRIAFTTGRDLVLSPKQAGEPLNYFIYPYVEVNGKKWSRENINCHFEYENSTSATK